MDFLEILIWPLLITLIFSVIMAMISKKKDKVDKGFVLNYHRLSYRRRYIRNLWGLPFIIIVYLGLFVFLDLSKTAYIVLAIALLIFPIELIYNFIKWKKTEQ